MGKYTASNSVAREGQNGNCCMHHNAPLPLAIKAIPGKDILQALRHLLIHQILCHCLPRMVPMASGGSAYMAHYGTRSTYHFAARSLCYWWLLLTFHSECLQNSCWRALMTFTCSSSSFLSSWCHLFLGILGVCVCVEATDDPHSWSMESPIFGSATQLFIFFFAALHIADIFAWLSFLVFFALSTPRLHWWHNGRTSKSWKGKKNVLKNEDFFSKVYYVSSLAQTPRSLCNEHYWQRTVGWLPKADGNVKEMIEEIW